MNNIMLQLCNEYNNILNDKLTDDTIMIILGFYVIFIQIFLVA